MNGAEFQNEDDDKVKVVTVDTASEEVRLRCLRAPSVGTVNCHSSKRKQVSLMSNGSSGEAENLTNFNKRRLPSEGLLSRLKNRDSACLTQANVGLNTCSEYSTESPGEEDSVNEFATSYKKPLYGISHKITEKKNSVTSDLLASFEIYDKINQCSSSGIRMFNDLRKRETGCNSVSSPVSDESNLYSLIQKMFFTLNTLNSNMSQLHSKVDLLSLEVSRIKKKVSPNDMVAEFHPPPEYQLTSTELRQAMDQCTSAGDLACRLLLQLFPELFGSSALSRNCSTCGYINKIKLESLHLQLIRNYVEACYPSVQNNAVWQVEVLPQVNEFFNRFWAER
ncbi:BEN domain-containing protein 3 isoform X2 [Pyxicephalus adspersus]|uniref:BEN domain-containing protein 3 isoform X2 n=1 Tax=Pyxicephalus adspersus TaxID=30357 RepID=UPI003B5B0632